MAEPVIKTIDVPCTPEKAFDIFVTNVSSWWPLGKNSVSAMAGKVAQSVTIEPKAGGRIYEIAHDGETHEWGSVAVYDPSDRLVLNWHINSPASEATLVEITFSPNSNGGTCVNLVHSGWEILGERGSDMREGYNSGWVSVFETAFKGACN